MMLAVVMTGRAKEVQHQDDELGLVLMDLTYHDLLDERDSCSFC